MLPLCYLALVFASHELVADVVECLVVHVQSIPKRKQRLHCVSYPNVCLFYAIQRSNDSTKKRMQTLSHMCYLNRHETNLNTYLYLMLVAPDGGDKPVYVARLFCRPLESIVWVLKE